MTGASKYLGFNGPVDT